VNGPNPATPVVDDRLLEQSAEELYDEAPCGYLSALPSGLIVKTNRTFLTWTGYQREAVIGRLRLQDLLTVSGKIYYETHYAPLLHMQGFANEIAFDFRRADQSLLPTLLNSVVKLDGHGKPLIIRTTLFNATDRRRYEQELLRMRRNAERNAKAKGDLLAMLSHDIRSPLSAIRNIAEVIAREDTSLKYQRHLRILRSSAGNALELIDNILSFSTVEAGAIRLQQADFSVHKLIERLVADLEPRANEKHLALVVDIDPAIPGALRGDPLRLGQILTNLLINAVKFTEQGSVRLSLRPVESDAETTLIEFVVADTGIGIAADRLDAIFREFTQANYDIGRRFGGTGLGLAIVRKLLELHESTMEVISEPGKGSKFSFRLRFGKRAGATQ
jgi:signal transduction histidine kinase